MEFLKKRDVAKSPKMVCDCVLRDTTGHSVVKGGGLSPSAIRSAHFFSIMNTSQFDFLEQISLRHAGKP